MDRHLVWIVISGGLIALLSAIVGMVVDPDWSVARLHVFLNAVGIIILASAMLIQERRPVLARILIGVSLLLVVPALILAVLSIGQR